MSETVPGWGRSLRAAWSVFWSSRLVVFGAAVWITLARLTPNVMTEYPRVSHPFGGWPGANVLDLVFSPLAKWDSVHYLAIALDGYSGQGELPPESMRPAFFPLYSGVVRVVSGFGSSPGLVLLVAYAVSLACFFAALLLLHRLAVIELGERYARPALMLLAFFPTALFFGIPYTESMFLLLAAAAFLAARTGHWALAGIALALASATRVPGLLLVVPVALLYLYGPRADREPPPGRGIRPRYRIAPDAGWILLAPLGLIAFGVYLHFALGDAFAWQHAQLEFGRRTIDPVTGIWHGLSEAGKSLGHILDGTYNQGTIYDHLNVVQVVFVAFAVVGGIGALRLLPAAYGTWVLISLVPIFVSQPEENPLFSSGRFIVILFPIFFWLATVCERRRSTTTVVALFAAGMAVFTVQFALWSFVG